MGSIVGGGLVTACIIGLGIWCLTLCDDLANLRHRMEQQSYEPTRRNADMERERKTRAEQIKALRQRVRYLEWLFRKMARGEPVPAPPADKEH